MYIYITYTIEMEIHYYQKFHQFNHFMSMPFFGNFAPPLTQSQVRHWFALSVLH